MGIKAEDTDHIQKKSALKNKALRYKENDDTQKNVPSNLTPDIRFN